MSAQPPAGSRPPGRRRPMAAFGWSAMLLPFIPAAVVLSLAGAGSTLVFVTSALGVIPTASLMGRATEELAARSGPGIGGLLNVTFGNAPELIIALFALGAGLQEVVKASIVGSIIGNVLLVLGASMLVGGWKRQHQRFNETAANVQSTMLLLAVAAIAMPAVYVLVSAPPGLPSPTDQLVSYGGNVETLSLVASGILLLAYLAGLFFSLKTHRDLFNPEHSAGTEESWSVRRSVIALAVAGALVALMSEILVGSIEETAQKIGLSEFFIGAIVVAIVGNAAEHWVAVLAAKKDQMDLSVNISIGSSAQVALFVAPVLVLASYVIGPGPMPLVLNGFELAAIVLAALIAGQVTQDGRSTWFEGLQLLSVYAIVAVAFFFA
ncbi:MAG: calcium/proton exchanger [Solirubrobacteraceae bacterium]|nr:calcium/proton exchanger [Solirubrobacteraceae bacterium]